MRLGFRHIQSLGQYRPTPPPGLRRRLSRNRISYSVLLGLDTDECRVTAADLDRSGTADGLDIQPFVNLLLAP